jgi:ribosomal protein S27E
MVEPAFVTFWRCGSWWRKNTHERGLETQVLKTKYQGPETQVLRAKCNNTRGPETQVLRAKYRGPETQVLRAKCNNTRHGRIVFDRHGYPLVKGR